MENKNAGEIGEFINIGTGIDITVKDLAALIRKIVYEDAPGRNCTIIWDVLKPNGTPRKLLDITRLSTMGWRAGTELKEGIKKAYAAFREITA
jgi:GDP-L-fucose synthase